MTTLDAYKVDHLILLVGGNPLPNYVAARVLVRESGCVHLLHTADTGSFASEIKAALQSDRPDVSVILNDVHKYNRTLIEKRLDELFKDRAKISETASVGLNYTGGTKAMAVHVYRTVERIFTARRIKPVFTYLDADTLSLVGDDMLREDQQISIGTAVHVSLERLMQLHGYRQDATQPIRRQIEQVRASLAHRIAQVHGQLLSHQQWRQWTRSDPLRIADLSAYPELSQFEQGLREIFSGTATDDDLQNKLATALSQPSLKSCTKWLIGDWLEDHVLSSLEVIADECDLADFGAAVKPRRQGSNVNFDMDVAAMRGYQLFAISCTTADDLEPNMASKNQRRREKEQCKEHLLEVYVRARQMGGDEAHVGLVCCIDDPESLEEEVKESWFTQGRVRVFGRNHLSNLSRHLKDWILTANKRRS